MIEEIDLGHRPLRRSQPIQRKADTTQPALLAVNVEQEAIFGCKTEARPAHGKQNVTVMTVNPSVVYAFEMDIATQKIEGTGEEQPIAIGNQRCSRSM